MTGNLSTVISPDVQRQLDSIRDVDRDLVEYVLSQKPVSRKREEPRKTGGEAELAAAFASALADATSPAFISALADALRVVAHQQDRARIRDREERTRRSEQALDYERT